MVAIVTKIRYEMVGMFTTSYDFSRLDYYSQFPATPYVLCFSLKRSKKRQLKTNLVLNIYPET